MERIICFHHTVSVAGRTLSPRQIQVCTHTQARNPMAEGTPASKAWHMQSSWQTDTEGSSPEDAYREGLEMPDKGENTGVSWPSSKMYQKQNMYRESGIYTEECSCFHCLHKERLVSDTCCLSLHSSAPQRVRRTTLRVWLQRGPQTAADGGRGEIQAFSARCLGRHTAGNRASCHRVQCGSEMTVSDKWAR